MDTKASETEFDSEVKCRTTRQLKARLLRIASLKEKQLSEVAREAAQEKAVKEEKGLRLPPITSREVEKLVPVKEEAAA